MTQEEKTQVNEMLETLDECLENVSRWNSTAMWSEIESFRNDLENALLRDEITGLDFWQSQTEQYAEIAGI